MSINHHTNTGLALSGCKAGTCPGHPWAPRSSPPCWGKAPLSETDAAVERCTTREAVFWGALTKATNVYKGQQVGGGCYQVVQPTLFACRRQRWRRASGSQLLQLWLLLPSDVTLLFSSTLDSRAAVTCEFTPVWESFEFSLPILSAMASTEHVSC